MAMTEQDLRVEALSKATAGVDVFNSETSSAEAVVNRAEAYFDFLNKSSETTPTQPATEEPTTEEPAA